MATEFSSNFKNDLNINALKTKMLSIKLCHLKVALIKCTQTKLALIFRLSANRTLPIHLPFFVIFTFNWIYLKSSNRTAMRFYMKSR